MYSRNVAAFSCCTKTLVNRSKTHRVLLVRLGIISYHKKPNCQTFLSARYKNFKRFFAGQISTHHGPDLARGLRVAHACGERISTLNSARKLLFLEKCSAAQPGSSKLSYQNTLYGM